MKTFKLISLQLVDDDNLQDIELKDGLIINREDDQKRWLIEAFLAPEYTGFFLNALEHNEEFMIQVVITKKENDPAPFRAKVLRIVDINSSKSVLLEGYLNKTKSGYAELLLAQLIDQGLSGDQLLETFKLHMITKPKLSTTKQIENQ